VPPVGVSCIWTVDACTGSLNFALTGAVVATPVAPDAAACCQPEAVSPANATVARGVPVVVHK
jgi:hypothetical protein